MIWKTLSDEKNFVSILITNFNKGKYLEKR